MNYPPVTASNEDLKKALDVLARTWKGDRTMHSAGTVCEHALKRILELERELSSK